MNLSRSTMKKIMLLILFAAVCLAASQHFSALGSAFHFILGILSPFLIGAAMAFILNVPMRSVEDLLFSSPKVQQRISAPLRRGISLLLTFLLVIAVIAVLVLVIVPQLTSTIAGLGGTIQSFFTRTIAWGQEMFANDPELLQWINSLSIDWTAINWESILNKVGNFLKNAIFGKVPFKSVNYIDCTAVDPEAECVRYSALLTANKCDIIIMGIGENGHIAFNDPHVADFNDEKVVKVVSLDETCRMQQVNDGCFAKIDDVPKFALTLTIPTLVAAESVFCIVPVKTKANAVKNTILGEVGEACPATILRRHDNATLYLDADSASLI